MADANGKTDWMIWNFGPDLNWDDELKRDFNALHSEADTILLSRKMAVEGFIGHWAAVAEKPEQEYAFARNITAARKVVFTKTLASAEWKNTTLAKGDFMEEVNRLKAQDGKDLIAYGGASFVSSLIKARLIDEYHLLINPTALGNGIAVFGEAGDRLNLKLIQAKAYRCGMAVLMYTM